MSESKPDAFRAPYLSFATFWKFVDELSRHNLPPVIDRSLMSGRSGSDQANLMTTLRAFGLIDEERNVLPEMSRLTDKDLEARRVVLNDLVQRHYAEPLDVSANTGTEVSPYFPSTRSGSGGPGQAKPRSRARKKSVSGAQDSSHADSQSPTAPNPEDIVVELRTGGTMRLSVNVSPITLRGFDREFFFRAVDLLDGYDAAAAKAYGDSGRTIDTSEDANDPQTADLSPSEDATT